MAQHQARVEGQGAEQEGEKEGETGAHARRVDGRTTVCAEEMEEHRWSFAKVFDNMGVISRAVGYAFQSKSLIF